MQFDAVKAIVDGVPNMTAEQGKIVYDFLLKIGAKNVLELGFAHGTGSCYMAAALQETGGKLLTIDRREAHDRKPSQAEQLAKCGLAGMVTPVFAHTSYTWELMKLIEQHTTDGKCEPFLDFVYIDGAHLWEPDGLAFFLVDKLLKVNGWILFDDLYWSLASSPSIKDADWVKALAQDEQDAPQVLRVFDLLVRQHPSYGNIQIVDWWGWAQKIDEQTPPNNPLAEIGATESFVGQVKRVLRPIVKGLR
jgi:predicted O-methyltransferase YrrM